MWEEDQADEGTEVFDEEVETNPGKRLLWEAEHGELSAVRRDTRDSLAYERNWAIRFFFFNCYMCSKPLEFIVFVLRQVQDTVLNHPESIQHSDSDGYTALHRASYNNHQEVR